MQNQEVFGHESLAIPHAQLKAFGVSPALPPAKPISVLSFSQLMKGVTVLFHYLLSSVHLSVKVLLVRGQGQSFWAIYQVQHIPFFSMEFCKCFFWQHYSHRVSDSGNFYFKHLPGLMLLRMLLHSVAVPNQVVNPARISSLGQPTLRSGCRLPQCYVLETNPNRCYIKSC